MINPKFVPLQRAKSKLFSGLVGTLLKHHDSAELGGNMHTANRSARAEVCQRVFQFVANILEECESEKDLWELEMLIEYCERVLGLKAVARTVRSNPFLLGFRILEYSYTTRVKNSSRDLEDITKGQSAFLKKQIQLTNATRANLSRVLLLFYVCRIAKGRVRSILSKESITELYEFTNGQNENKEIPAWILKYSKIFTGGTTSASAKLSLIQHNTKILRELTEEV